MILRIAALGLCLLILAGTLAANLVLAESLPDQQAAKYWGSGEMPYAQLSLFLDKNLNFGDMERRQLYGLLQNALEQESVSGSTKSSRLIVDAVSSETTVTAVNKNAAVQVRATVTEGDFFTFHPLTMVSGWYYSTLDTMDDTVVLDRELAWRLFGSTDVVGMTLYVNGYPCVVAGISERPHAKAEDKCYGDDPRMYMTRGLYAKTGGEALPITCVELLLPEPVKGFARRILSDSLSIDAGQYECVENSLRFRIDTGFTELTRFASRVQRVGSIYYPWWENAARYLESLSSFLVLAAAVSLIYPVVIAFVYIGKGIRHRRRAFAAVKSLTMKLYHKTGMEEKIRRKKHEKDF